MKVLYIGGAGRSGSTLLEIILGNLPSFFSVGEVRFFWEYVIRDNSRCGCLAALPDCLFWEKVIRRLKQEPFDLSYIATLAQQIDRTHKTFWLQTPFPYRQAPTKTFLTATKILYQTIVETADCDVLVDSSKVPSHLHLLHRIPEIDLHVLHLVRDGRAVAHAWNKQIKRRLDETGHQVLMPQHSSIKSLLVWMLENHFVTRLGQQLSTTRYTILRYEDFAQSPFPTLQKALDALGLDFADLSHLQNEQVELSSTHSVGGNPIRFQQRPIEIVLDEEWRKNMSTTNQKLLGLLATPTLRSFQYKI